ncbi:Protein of unknown function [Cotesia congregata]|uniref:Uncharacterized protein n=1 Tax=Cotesia congregata TaxID=51543 RepID=A0A8J2HFM7_COTCN|nr:Protein of unknown function [Cotesia congregata]
MSCKTEDSTAFTNATSENDSKLLEEIKENLSVNRPRVYLKRLSSDCQALHSKKKLKFTEEKISHVIKILPTPDSSGMCGKKLAMKKQNLIPSTPKTTAVNMNDRCSTDEDLPLTKPSHSLKTNIFDPNIINDKCSVDDSKSSVNNLDTAELNNNMKCESNLPISNSSLLLTTENIENIPVIFSSTLLNDVDLSGISRYSFNERILLDSNISDLSGREIDPVNLMHDHSYSLNNAIHSLNENNVTTEKKTNILFQLVITSFQTVILSQKILILNQNV